MHRPQVTLPFTATTAVVGCRVVKHGAANGAAVQATASTEAFAGVADIMGAPAGGTLDVHVGGPVDVDYGGNVARGDPLTANADGKAVKADPAAGATAQVFGHALLSGVAGDRGSAMLGRSTLTKPAA